MELIIRLLLGIVSLRTGSAERQPIAARVWADYFKGGFSPARKVGGCGVTNVPEFKGTIATTEFGLTVDVIEVSLTGWLEEKEAIFLLGEYPWYDSDNGPRLTKYAFTHVECIDGRYRVKTPSQFMDTDVLVRSISMLLPATIDMDRIVPGPLSLLTSKTGALTLCLTRKGTPSFTERCAQLGVDPVVLSRRFPKDAWNVPTGERTLVRMMVVAGGTSHDGNFFIRSGLNTKALALYRGMGMHDGKAFLVKGRGIVHDSIIPEGLDGVISTDNIKWNTVPAGTVIELALVPSTDETAHAKDRYGWHSMAMLFMQSDARTRGSMRRRFVGHVERTVDSYHACSNPTGFLSYITRATEMGDSVAVCSDLAKVVLGIASEDEAFAVWRKFHERTKSMRVNGVYPAVIFATEWEGREIDPTAPLFNKAAADAFKKNDMFGVATMLRYPVASYGSYLLVTLNAANQISLADDDPIIIAHPRCASHLQGDGDDHVLLTNEYISTFSPMNDVIQARSYERTNDVDVLSTIIDVWKASSGIGMIFNAMAKAIGAMYTLGKSEEEIGTEMQWFGGMLDLYAQAVKKPFKLVPASEITARAESWAKRAEDMEMSPEQYLSTVFGTNLRNEKKAADWSNALNNFYGVTAADVIKPEMNPAAVRPLTKRNNDQVAAWVGKTSNITNLYAARSWHKALMTELLKDTTIEVLFEHDKDRLANVLHTYASIAYRLATRNKYCLETMNGCWVAVTQFCDL